MQILNKDKASCQLLGFACQQSEETEWKKWTLRALEIAGAQTSVKAILAAAYGHTPLRCIGHGLQTWKTYRTEKERKHKAFIARPLDHVVHALVMPIPGQDQPYEVITSRTSATPQDGLYQVLQLYTPYPVLRPWCDLLFEEGQNHYLIDKLETVGTMEWAYLIGKHWDELIDKLAKEGRLPVNG